MSDAPKRRRRPTLSDLQAGDELSDRYRIIRQLGSGGMGAVYEAEQIKLHKRVALKIMHPERAIREKSVQRFLREARAASAIKHRNVVDILDFGELEDGTTYLVMELLHGTDLSSLLKEHGPLDWPRTRGILLQVLRGLKAAHDNKIIHRDIKAANVFLVDPDDEYAKADDRVKVLDFGIARIEQAGDEIQELTGTAELLGTVTYMAPELAQKGHATAQSDIYAVGILAYKMLTGMTPFGGGTSFQVLYSHTHDEPPPPRSLVPSIPAAVEAVILRTLAKDPRERFDGAHELGRALASIDDDGTIRSKEISEVLQEPTFPMVSGPMAVALRASVPIELEPEPDRWSRRRVMIGALGVLMAGAGAWMWLGSEETATAPVRSNAEAAARGDGEASRRSTPGESEAGSSGTAEGTGPAGQDAGEEPAEANGEQVASTGGVSPEPASSEDRRRRKKHPRKPRTSKKTTPEPTTPAPGPAALPLTPSKADMRPVQKKAEQAARECGERKGALAKSIDIKFDIDPKGKVVNARAQGSHKGTPVGSCLASAMEKSTFPASQRGAKGVTWTLSLR